MEKRARIGITLVPVGLFALIVFVGLTLTVHGEGPSRRLFVPQNAPVLQGGFESEPNDTIATADDIAVNLTMVGDIPQVPSGDIDFYRLVIPDSDVGRDFRVTLSESPTSGDYQLKLSLYDAEGDFINSGNTTGGETFLDWTSSVITYYFSVEGVTVDADAPYEIGVIRFDAPPEPTPTATPVPWDDCEINDNIDGAWPGGPCLLSVGIEVTDLNFVPQTGQPVPNDDYFTFLAKAGHLYRISTTVSGGADTEMWLYDPSNSQVAYDDDGGDGLASRVEITLGDGFYKIRVRDRTANATPSTAQIYDILVEDITTPTNTPTPTGTPGTPTVTPTPLSIPGEPDAFEPNYDFERASLIGLDTLYTNLNFVPWTGAEPDNDFYKLWVVAGKLYTCETSDLGSATNTNMILYSGPGFEYGFAGNDDVVPFDPNDPYRSRITFFSSYNGYVYILLGQVGASQILPEEWANLSYSLKCFIEQPGTATPTPTSAFVPPPPTSTPQPTSPTQPTPVPTNTPAQLVVLPMTTPEPPPPSVPVATPTPVVRVVEVLLYFDWNDNGSADTGEGISDVLTRAYDALTGDLLSIDYTDPTGYLRFALPTSAPVRLNIPFFGFDQIVTTTDANLQIRIAPYP